MPSQEVYSHQDFSEYLKLEFYKQVQKEYYAGWATVSLEGVTVKFFPSGDDTTVMEFHSYFSDGKLQDSSVVHNHMTKLIEHLKVFFLYSLSDCRWDIDFSIVVDNVFTFNRLSQ